jgi:hypothetical protein
MIRRSLLTPTFWVRFPTKDVVLITAGRTGPGFEVLHCNLPDLIDTLQAALRIAQKGVGGIHGQCATANPPGELAG